MKKFSICMSAIMTALIFATCTLPSQAPEAQPPETKPTATPPTVTPSARTPEAAAAPKPIEKVGIAMPTRSLQRWSQDMDLYQIITQLNALGCELDIQYANNEVAVQAAQIENMILGGCQVLVIASVDPKSLSDVLSTAKEKGIIVIAYDRLIEDTDAVDYYITFDNFLVGVIQGEYIRDALKLDTEDGPFNMELFAGAPDDTNAEYFFNGAMSILQPYVDSGKINILSGQTAFEDIAVSGWRTEGAQVRMDNLIDSYYSKGAKLDAVLSPNDSLAIGIANALEDSGYVSAGKPFPLITGQDCDIPNCKYMIAGKQSMSVFKDTRVLENQVAETAKAIVSGITVPVNDTSTYFNGIKAVPTFLCAPVTVDKDNIDEILIETDYYIKEQIYD